MPVQRRMVRLPDVTLATIRDGVGYMKVEGFSDGTAQETGQTIRQLQAESPNGDTYYIHAVTQQVLWQQQGPQQPQQQQQPADPVAQVCKCHCPLSPLYW